MLTWLQQWGGHVTEKGVLIAEPLPEWMGRSPDLVSRIRETGAFDDSAHGAPNHCVRDC